MKSMILVIAALFCSLFCDSNAIEECTAWNSWTQSDSTVQEYWDIASDSSGQYLATIVHDVTTFEGYIYTSNDYGSTWTISGAEVPGSNVWNCITTDATGRYIAAAVNDGFIYVSTDYGATWEEVATNQDVTDFYWTSITSDSTGQYYAASTSEGFIYTNDNYGSGDWNPSGALTLGFPLFMII